MKCKYDINQYYLCPNCQRLKHNVSLSDHPCKYAKNDIIGEIYCDNKKENKNEN